MGYSRTLPFVAIPSTQGTVLTRQAILTTTSGTKTMGTIKTLDYGSSITHVFARLYVQTVKNTNAAENCTALTAQRLNLNDGVIDINAGTLSGSNFLVPGNGYAHNIVVHFPTNIVSQIKPDTSYTCTLLDGESILNTLEIYYPQVTLDCYSVI